MSETTPTPVDDDHRLFFETPSKIPCSRRLLDSDDWLMANSPPSRPTDKAALGKGPTPSAAVHRSADLDTLVGRPSVNAATGEAAGDFWLGGGASAPAPAPVVAPALAAGARPATPNRSATTPRGNTASNNGRARTPLRPQASTNMATPAKRPTPPPTPASAPGNDSFAAYDNFEALEMAVERSTSKQPAPQPVAARSTNGRGATSSRRGSTSGVRGTTAVPRFSPVPAASRASPTRKPSTPTAADGPSGHGGAFAAAVAAANRRPGTPKRSNSSASLANSVTSTDTFAAQELARRRAAGAGGPPISPIAGGRGAVAQPQRFTRSLSSSLRGGTSGAASPTNSALKPINAPNPSAAARRAPSPRGALRGSSPIRSNTPSRAVLGSSAQSPSTTARRGGAATSTRGGAQQQQHTQPRLNSTNTSVASTATTAPHLPVSPTKEGPSSFGSPASSLKGRSVPQSTSSRKGSSVNDSSVRPRASSPALSLETATLYQHQQQQQQKRKDSASVNEPGGALATQGSSADTPTTQQCRSGTGRSVASQPTTTRTAGATAGAAPSNSRTTATADSSGKPLGAATHRSGSRSSTATVPQCLSTSAVDAAGMMDASQSRDSNVIGEAVPPTPRLPARRTATIATQTHVDIAVGPDTPIHGDANPKPEDEPLRNPKKEAGCCIVM